MIGLTAWLTAIDKGAWRLEIQSGSGSREETAKAQVDGNATVAFLDLYDLNVWDVYQLLKKGLCGIGSKDDTSSIFNPNHVFMLQTQTEQALITSPQDHPRSIS